MFLVDAQCLGRAMKGAEGFWSGQEIDIDPRDPVCAELDIARAGTGVPRGFGLAPQLRDDVGRHSAGSTFGIDTCLGHASIGQITHRIDTRIAGLQRKGIDRNPATLGQPCRNDHICGAVLRNTKEKIAGQ